LFKDNVVETAADYAMALRSVREKRAIEFQNDFQPTERTVCSNLHTLLNEFLLVGIENNKLPGTGDRFVQPVILQFYSQSIPVSIVLINLSSSSLMVMK
jgi:hypothetical protein